MIRFSVKFIFVGISVSKSIEMVSKTTIILIFTLFTLHINARSVQQKNKEPKEYKEFIERSRDLQDEPGFEWDKFFSKLTDFLSLPFVNTVDEFFCFYQQFCKRITNPNCRKFKYPKRLDSNIDFWKPFPI